MKNAVTRMARWGALGAVLSAGFAGNAVGQELIIYPAAGQSTEQQDRDTFECHRWATSQTGFDPQREAQRAAQAQQQATNRVTSPPPSSRQGAVVRGAGTGALIGGIASGGSGARRGAAAGAMFGGVRRASAANERAQWEQHQRAQQQQQQQQIAAQYQQGLNTYNRAVAACMQARDYQVN